MAESDQRENILERIKTLAAGLQGVKKAMRNALDIPEKDRPAIVILDADETPDTSDGDGRPMGRPGLPAPLIMEMTPEIYILAGGAGESVGSVLNSLRIQLIKALYFDQTLLSFCKDGDIRYMGFSTGFAAGRSIEGEAGISFRFRYVIHPTKL
jgi:hypothetical protein